MLKVFAVGLVLGALTTFAESDPGFPANPRGRVTTTCAAKSPGDVAWLQTAFETGGVTGSHLNVIGTSSVDGSYGAVGSRYLPYVDGPFLGVIQAWGSLHVHPRVVLNVHLKRGMPLTSLHDATLTLEGFHGARDVLMSCCVGRFAPNGAECQPIERAVLAAVSVTLSDASLSESEKIRRIERLLALPRFW